ncbi:3-oxoacyl-ACP synthase [Streptomyces tateyamensis]|uniref:Beta-ketoacyl-[acyl-carrier-protein] synthase III n=1 Tax=Streptomyces tateyamensis TaxID=565073 RepID=A0A2V4N657_9ACTN|nr:beta-ketoacyl-ACP synthase 3 [Streptomyces tateyamensis]PYC79487.1 3-oxoacyl-ACP synthase [Streptomyces tateyamensis]
MNAPTSARGARTAVIAGLGASLPPRELTNAQIIDRGALDTSDEWITRRTGIRRRRLAGPGISTGDLATAAARAATEAAGPAAGPPDLLVLATTTPDRPCPATAPEVAHRLGLGPVPAFDLSAVCSGFLYALATAGALVRSGTCRAPLVVAAEKYSAIIDPFDRDTAPLFGDGAAAVLLRAGNSTEPGALLATDWGSDGSGSDLIAVAAGGSRLPAAAGPDRADRYFRMQGRPVYAQAVRHMTASAAAVLAATGWPPDEVRAFVGHQANQRILDAVADRLGIAAQHRFGNLREVGNTAGASVPLALADAVARGVCPPGAPTLLSAFGGGLTWASVTLRWPDAPVRTAVPEPRALARAHQEVSIP